MFSLYSSAFVFFSKLYCFYIILNQCIIGRSLSIFVYKCCEPNAYFNESLKCFQNLNSSENDNNWLNKYNLSILTSFKPCNIPKIKIEFDLNYVSFYKESSSIRVFDTSLNKTINYSINSYCVERWLGKEIVYICPCLEYSCVWKCCVPGKQLSPGGYCIPQEDNESDWDGESQLSRKETSSYKYLPTVHGSIDCDTRHYHQLRLRGSYSIQDDASIDSSVDGNFQSGQYCGDFERTIPDINDAGPRNSVVIACVPRSIEESWRHLVICGGGVAAAILLGMTLLVLAVVPESRGAAGGPLVAHVFCLMLASIATVLSHLHFQPQKTLLCYFISYSQQCFYYLSFIWLTILCFAMGRSFSGIGGYSGGPSTSTSWKWKWNHVISWGSAFLLIASTAIADFTPLLNLNSHYRPNIGLVKCWFQYSESTWIFFYGPMCVLLLTNLCLFMFTVWRVKVLGRESGVLRRHSSQSQHSNIKFVLFIKMFTLMGILWIFEIISWCIGGPSYIWYLTDFLNLSRAGVLLSMVCYRPRIRRHLRSAITNTSISSISASIRRMRES